MSLKWGVAKKKAKKKINKKEILSRLTLVPTKDKRLFYMREMKILNDLCERYSEEFMNIVSFDKKFDSLAYISCDKLKMTMDLKFRAFNFKVDESKYVLYSIGDKEGEDVIIEKSPKTTKQFLNEQ
jgi:hypothetical protein